MIINSFVMTRKVVMTQTHKLIKGTYKWHIQHRMNYGFKCMAQP